MEKKVRFLSLIDIIITRLEAGYRPPNANATFVQRRRAVARL